MKTPLKTKRITNILGGLLISLSCLFISYSSYQNGFSDIENTDYYKGIIIDKGITSYETSTSAPYRIKITKKAFYVKLEGLNQLLATYNRPQSYSSLDNNLNLGDTVEVYFNSSNQFDKVNLETFRIKKNNLIVIDQKKLQNSEKAIFFFSLLISFLFLILTFYLDRKYKRVQFK